MGAHWMTAITVVVVVFIVPKLEQCPRPLAVGQDSRR